MIDMKGLARHTRTLLEADPFLGCANLHDRLCFDLGDTTWAELLEVYRRVLTLYGPIADAEQRTDGHQPTRGQKGRR